MMKTHTRMPNSDRSRAGANECCLYYIARHGWLAGWDGMARYSSICLSPRYVRNVQWKPMIRVRGDCVSARTREYIKIKREHEIIVMSTRSLCCQNEIINGKMNTTHTHTHGDGGEEDAERKQIKTGRTTSSCNTWNAHKITIRTLCEAQMKYVFMFNKNHTLCDERERERDREATQATGETFNLIYFACHI